MKDAPESGLSAEITMAARVLATSVVETVTKHGCQLTRKKSSSKAAKIVEDTSFRFICGRTTSTGTERRKVWKTMENLI